MSKEEAELFAEQENLLFYECSAKTTFNLNELFLHAANIVDSRLESKELSNEEEVFILLVFKVFEFRLMELKEAVKR